MNKKSIKKAIFDILSEQIIVHGTDTVFGLSGSYKSNKAYKKIYNIKGRSFDKPLGILIGNLKQVEVFTDYDISKNKGIEKLFLMGVTIIFPIGVNIPKHLLKQSNYIALRMPNHQMTKKIIEITGPLVSTSANISGSDPIKSEKECKQIFDDEIFFLKNHEPLTHISSTIIKLGDNESDYIILREGSVDKNVIYKHLNLPING